MTRTRIYWTCQILGWALIPSALAGVALISGGLFIVRGATPPATVAFSIFMWYPTCVFGSHGIHLVSARCGWLRHPRWGVVPGMVLTVVAMALLATVASEAIQTAARPLLDPGTTRPLPSARSVIGSSLFVALVLGVWTVAYALAVTGMRLRDAERERLGLRVELAEAESERLGLRAALAESQLASLERQLNPHFLFNVLNTVRSLVTTAPREARRAVTLLASMLRQTLTSTGDTSHALADELELVEAYLAIEGMRFRERVGFRVAATPEARSALVPALMVLTLVENAVKHGIAQRRSGGEVSVEASVDGGLLSVVVTNPVPVPAPSRRAATESTGTGLANAQERLVLLYGDAARLTLDVDPDRATARLSLPAALAPARRPASPAPVTHA